MEYVNQRAARLDSQPAAIDRRTIVYAWDLLRELVVRDIKVRYQRSLLGVLWSLVTPLMQILVFYFLFRVVLNLNIPRYSSFAFSGLLAWNWFQSSLSQAASAITGNRDLIRRPGFPATVLPVVSVTTNLIHFMLALPILLLFLTLEGMAISGALLMLLPVIALQFFLTLSLAYLVASLNVIFRDVQHILVVLLQLFFFLTPIFYDVGKVPAPFQPLYGLNPLVRLVEAYRAILIHGVHPDWSSLVLPTVLAIGLFHTGYQTFVRVKYRFVEEL